MKSIRVVLADDHKMIRAGLRLVVENSSTSALWAKLTMEGKRWNWSSR